jgi:ubiquinone/menaquinone biosynthesis methyltransferase
VSELIPHVAERAAAPEHHASAVREMFDRIAPTYDRLNKTLSAGIDAAWRKRSVRVGVEGTPKQAILDLCAGTMDMTALLALERPGARIVAADFAAQMLQAGRAKVPRAETVVADALSLPFADGEFDLVACAFGVRNLADVERGASEARRVLAPGGVLVVLEFFRPTRAVTRAFHAAYARGVLPMVGGLVSGDRAAYEYLAESMRSFLSREEYQRLLERVGFVKVRGEDLTLGVASIVRAEVKR